MYGENPGVVTVSSPQLRRRLSAPGVIMLVSFQRSWRYEERLVLLARRRRLRMRRQQPTPRQARSRRKAMIGRTIMRTRFFFPLEPESAEGVTAVEVVLSGS